MRGRFDCRKPGLIRFFFRLLAVNAKLSSIAVMKAEPRAMLMTFACTIQRSLRGGIRVAGKKGNPIMSLRNKLLGAVLALAVTAGTANAQIVVSSKIDTEGGVLGNIILLMFNANGIAATDRLQLGGTPVMRKAIMAGEIDIYPEYTGNGAFFFQ